MSPLPTDSFTDWLLRSLALWPGGLRPARDAEYRALVVETASHVEGDVWRCVPGIVREVFGRRGWAWNGIYGRTGEALRLFAAAGPPVCNTLEPAGGVGTSGMCFDALLMNQTVVAADVSRWPGYRSCDGESGLRTVAGIVCPIRGARGVPVAVWDLDATEPLAPEDGPFLDRFFATLSAILEPDARVFAVR